MADLPELSDRLAESLVVAPQDDDDLLHPEVELRYLRETVRPVMTEYARDLAESGATESAGHIVRLLAIISERVLGPDVLRQPSFAATGAALDDLRSLADEWTAGEGASGSPHDPGVEPAPLARLEADAASGELTTTEKVKGLDAVAAWLEEPGRSFTAHDSDDLLRRIDAVWTAPKADRPTLAEALRLIEVRGRCHAHLVPAATT